MNTNECTWSLNDVIRHIKNGAVIGEYDAQNNSTSFCANGEPCVSIRNWNDIVVNHAPWQNVHWELRGKIIDKNTQKNIGSVMELYENPDGAVVDLVALARLSEGNVEIKLGMYNFTFKLTSQSTGTVMLIGPCYQR